MTAEVHPAVSAWGEIVCEGLEYHAYGAPEGTDAEFPEDHTEEEVFRLVMCRYAAVFQDDRVVEVSGRGLDQRDPEPAGIVGTYRSGRFHRKARTQSCTRWFR